MADDDLITLDEAAKVIPGADAGTLKRMARKGTLTVYRPGKAYLTTAADVREAIKKSRVVSKKAPYRQLKEPDVDQARRSLNAALAPPSQKKKR